MRLPKPTPSLFISVAALVIALGGTSYAAITINGGDIKKGTVTSKQIKNKTVKGADISKNAVGSGKVKDNSLKAKDFKKGELPAGPQGPAGIGRWALINAAGQIEAQSGGFSITSAYPVLPNTLPAPGDNSLRANGNVYINTGEPLTNNGVVATIALQNTVDQNGDTITNGRAEADENFEFAGEISVSQCGLPGTACAPPGTGTVSHVVVSPRNSDGTPTGDGQRKRFYVVITGDSTDRVG